MFRDMSVHDGFLYADVDGQIWRFKEGEEPVKLVEDVAEFEILDDMIFFRKWKENDLYAMSLSGGSVAQINLPVEIPDQTHLEFISCGNFIALKGNGISIYLYKPTDGSITKLP